jgi:hypothetical protein
MVQKFSFIHTQSGFELAIPAFESRQLIRTRIQYDRQNYKTGQSTVNVWCQHIGHMQLVHVLHSLAVPKSSLSRNVVSSVRFHTLTSHFSTCSSFSRRMLTSNAGIASLHHWRRKVPQYSVIITHQELQGTGTPRQLPSLPPVRLIV